MNDTLKNEADYFGSIIQDLQEQSKRYREVIEEIRDYMVDEINLESNPSAHFIKDICDEALEESE